MKNWFTCKVKYEKIDENGKNKKVTEQYLVDAISFTEAEARMYEKISEMVDGEFYIDDISRTKITDILKFDDCGTWYKAKVKYDSCDELTGKAKKVTNEFLIGSVSVEEANERLKEELKTMLVPYDITSVVLSPILDIFEFESIN